MAKEKCNYCGNEYDEQFFGTLNNGSNACMHCVEEEEQRIAQRDESEKEEKKQ